MTVTQLPIRSTLIALAQGLPNLLSLARLIAAPIAIYFILIDVYDLAFWLFAAAAATDAIDGGLARLLRARTLLGSYLDPIADKSLLVGCYAALGFTGTVPLWVVVLVVARDLFIVGGAVLIWLLTPRAVGMIRPSLVSKVNTGLQVILAAVALAAAAWGFAGSWLVTGLSVMVAITTVLSGGGYLADARRALADAMNGDGR